MKMSVAMCTYNGTMFLDEQLQSIARQNRLPDELVICDDNSQDSTVDIIRRFAETVSFPVHLHINEFNLGAIKNFEKSNHLCVKATSSYCLTRMMSGSRKNSGGLRKST